VFFGWLVYLSVVGLADAAQTVDMTLKAFLAAKTVAVSIAFVTTAIFYSKWMSHYFQRTANEEYRLRSYFKT
jgi:hypothetical protein